jgi:hypothetical protein
VLLARLEGRVVRAFANGVLDSERVRYSIPVGVGPAGVLSGTVNGYDYR